MSNLIKTIFIILLPFPLHSAILDVTSGPTSGQTTVRIDIEVGEVIGSPVTVTIGGQEAVVESSSLAFIVLKTPAGVGKDLPVVITWPLAPMGTFGTLIASDQFSYDIPDMETITPFDFLTRGGETATITGSNFGSNAVGPAEVRVGGNLAEVITQNHSQITIRIPVGKGANKNVRVRVGDQLSNILQVNYLPPSIWKIEPMEARPAPGDTFYIYGVNFGDGYDLPVVKMGEVTCQEVIYGGDDRLYAVTGIGIPLSLEVKVEVGGQSSLGYPLKNKQPRIVSVLDGLWDPAGGENITLNAINMGQDLTKISLDLNGEDIPITSVSGNGIMFISIAGSGKDLPLKVTVNGVISEAYNMSYEQSVLNDVSPATGNTIGSSPITISGIGIGAGGILPSVLFGNKMASNVQAVNDNQITCLLPAGVGPVDVKLDLNGVTSNTLSFTYNSPQIFGVAPLPIPLSGGELTISGIELGNEINDVVVIADGLELVPTAVNFGAVTVDLPAGFGQGKTIQVKVGGILSNTLNYTYSSPSVTNISPSNGLPGEVLTITGINLGGRTIPSMVTIDGNPAGILTSSNDEIRCLVPAGIGMDKTVEVSIGNTADSFVGFSYDNPPSSQDQKVEVVGQLRITDLPFKKSNGILLGVDSQGNLVRNTSPQIFVSITNDTLFLGANQFLVIPGISKANGGN